jgi:hypothetical protein
MDFSAVDKYGLAHDLVKVALFNVLVHVAMEIQYNNSRDLFGHKFIYQLLFVLAGFAIFYLVVEPHIKAYFNALKKAVAK